MTEPRVSCILTAYNAERFLAQALDSLLAQTGVRFEVIVVDDGSTDSTAAMVERYGSALRLLHQTNSGQAAARNRGILESRGELVTFMDADDLSPQNRFALQVNAFDRTAGLDVCVGKTQNFEGDLSFVGEAVHGFNSDAMIRRSAFDRVGLFQPELQHAGKLEWMLRARAAGLQELLLPEILVYRRLHERNLSRAGANESLREHLHVLHARLRETR